jgi:gliding motility-associated-like protein
MIFLRSFFLKLIIISLGVLLNQGLTKAQCNLLCNTDFEDSQITTSVTIVDASLVPCWKTTASDNYIEVWHSGFNGVPAYSGNQFLELNAVQVSTLYQNFTVSIGASLSISFAHRGRQGVDVMSVDIGPNGGPYTTLGSYSDGNGAWGYYTVNYTIPMGLGNNYTLRFNSISSAGGNPSVGNFLDDISVNLPDVTLTSNITNASCGIGNGAATANLVGGISPYTYLWSSSPTQTTQTASGLVAGVYYVSVTDSIGCTITASDTIKDIPIPIVHVRGRLNPLCDSSKLDWAAWTTVNATSGSGTISSNLSVLVTKPSGGLSTTGGMFNGGVFPAQYNVPANSTAIRNDLAGLFTFCFNTPVVNPQIALSSIGSPGNSVQINTSAPYQVIWSGIGMSYPSNTAFIGTEGYTIIKFPGTHTCISFNYLQSETYCNLAFGVLDTNCQAGASPPICAGGSDTLTASGATTYVWTPATGLNNTAGAVVIASPSVTTKYYVTGTVGNNCSSTDSIIVTINPIPIAKITGDTIICIGDSTTLTASGGKNYLWLPGNFIDSVITIKPTTTITYTVVASNTSGCIDSSTITITVNPLPHALFNLSPVCQNEAMTYSDASTATISNWSWNFGDTHTSAVQNPVHGYSTCGTFNNKLVVTNNYGCKDSITHTLTVNCLPLANFGFIDVCLHQPANFHDSSMVSGGSITNWLWSFGDSSSSVSTQNPNYVYAHPGTYTVSLIVTTNNGCKDTITKNIVVHPLPVVRFSTSNVCDGTSVPFSDLSSIIPPDLIQSRFWNFGDGNTDNINVTISHPYTTASSYTVKLVVVSNFGCSDSITKTSVVNPNPVVNFIASDTAGCEPLCVSFQSLSTGNNVQFVWNEGDGTINNSQSFEHCYTNDSVYLPNSFNVTLTVTSDSGCVISKTKNNYITVFPLPAANFTVQPATASIINPIITITDLSIGANFWNWNFGNNETASTQNPDARAYADTGTYQITLIISTQYNCLDTAYQTIIIEPDFTFFIPNAFSPNNDGVNDTFTGQGLFIKTFEMTIFDRWGNLIYLTDDINKPWDGKANHGTEMAQQDVYVYNFNITDFKNKKHNYKGIVALVK